MSYHALDVSKFAFASTLFFFLVHALVVHKLRYRRLLIYIPGLIIYINWHHIFHIDIDTFATCKWIFEIQISAGYLELKNALKPVLGWYVQMVMSVQHCTKPTTLP